MPERQLISREVTEGTYFRLPVAREMAEGLKAAGSKSSVAEPDGIINTTTDLEAAKEALCRALEQPLTPSGAAQDCTFRGYYQTFATWTRASKIDLHLGTQTAEDQQLIRDWQLLQQALSIPVPDWLADRQLEKGGLILAIGLRLAPAAPTGYSNALRDAISLGTVDSDSAPPRLLELSAAICSAEFTSSVCLRSPDKVIIYKETGPDS